MSAYKYKAFISYRHLEPDRSVAARLQKMLENYTPPKAIAGDGFERWHIFRDETELPTSSNLSEDIREALECSEFLIVVCSEATAASRWCMEEITYFKKLCNGSNAKIVTIVAKGEPSKVFPYELCNESVPIVDVNGTVKYQNRQIEPLAANVAAANTSASLRKLKTEFLRVAAPLIGCGYDDLYNRHQRQHTRNILVASAVVVGAVAAFGIYSGAMLLKINGQNRELQTAYKELDKTNQTLIAANDELERKTVEAEKNLAEANRQKGIANENLDEANTQRKNAEANLAEANRQRSMAEDNLAEAKRQERIADSNASEAERQRRTAEKNMLTAQENEARANDANRELRIKNSDILASQASMYYDNDNLPAAITTALQAMPNGDDDDLPYNPVAIRLLSDATGAYSNESRMLNNKLNLPGNIKYMKFSDDGLRLLVTDKNDAIYIIDTVKCEILNVFKTYETFGSNGSLKFFFDGEVCYALCNDVIISIDVASAQIKWKCNHVHPSGRYDSWGNIISNEASETFFVTGNNSYHVMSKNGEVLYSNYDPVAQKYSSVAHPFRSSPEIFMDSDGQIYANWNNCLYVLDPLTGEERTPDLNLSDKIEVLSFGEDDSSVFVNIGIKDEASLSSSYTNAEVLCIDKADLSLKWATKYSVDGYGMDSYDLNKIFELHHRIPGDNEDYIEHDGIFIVSGKYIQAFEKDIGEEYFDIIYDNNLIYCDPHEKYYMTLVDSKSLMELYITSEKDSVTVTQYSFDKKRAYVDMNSNGYFALASENSSEISLYHKILSEHTTLTNMSGSDISHLLTSNGSGVLAKVDYKYQDAGDGNTNVISQILIYDVLNDELLSNTEFEGSIKNISYLSKDRLLLVYSDGNAFIVNNTGDIVFQTNLIEDIFEKVISAERPNYISIQDIYVTHGKVICRFYHGIFISEWDGRALKPVSHIDVDTSGDFYVSDDGSYVCFQVSHKNSEYKFKLERKLACLNVDSGEMTYVQNEGKDYIADSGIVKEMSCTDKKLAFLSEEGYVGLYSYGKTNYKKSIGKIKKH